MLTPHFERYFVFEATQDTLRNLLGLASCAEDKNRVASELPRLAEVAKAIL